MNARLFGCLLLVPVIGFAQGAPKSPGAPAQIRARVVQIENEIGTANFTCDYKYFAQVEADEFVFTDAAGRVTTRQQDLAGEKDCHKTQGTYVLDETRVSVYDSVAVVMSRATTTTRDKDGTPMVRVSRFTDVFVWRSGRWQLVAGHSSRILARGAAPQQSGRIP